MGWWSDDGKFHVYTVLVNVDDVQRDPCTSTPRRGTSPTEDGRGESLRPTESQDPVLYDQGGNISETDLGRSGGRNDRYTGKLRGLERGYEILLKRVAVRCSRRMDIIRLTNHWREWTSTRDSCP